MIHTIVDGLVHLLEATRMSAWLIVTILSFFPIVESRLGMLIGMRLGLTDFQSWIFAFVGSSLAAPFVIIFVVPLLGKMIKAKMFVKLSSYFADMFGKHASKIDKSYADTTTSNTPNKSFKRMLAIFVFVALPGPFTGVWGGSIVASLIKLSFIKATISVVAGNLVSSILLLVLSDVFQVYLDYIIFAIIIIAVISVATLLARTVRNLIKRTKPA